MKKLADVVATDGSKFILYLDDSQPPKPAPPNPWDEVSEDELNAFIDSFPAPLSEDLYMDWYSWNDFSRGVWPQSMVAMAYRGRDETDPDKFKILKDLRNEHR
jgi:hypothetical protein